MTQKEEILNSTDGGLDIFRHLIPKLPPIKNGSKLSGHFKSPWRDEKHASTHLYKENGTWLFKDLGDGSAGSIFDFIMKWKGVDFSGALVLASEYANIPLPEAKKTKEPEDVILLPDAELVERVLSVSDTAFHAFCLDLGITAEHLAKWGVGGFQNKAGVNVYTSFVYRKDDQTPVNIKHVAYGSDGKRNKEVKPWSMTSTIKGEVYRLCLFGEHLLSGSKPVCIVESEKTAAIASFFYPDYDWLATGGVFGARKLDYVRNGLSDGRQMLVLVDADPIRKVPKAMETLLNMGAKVETVDLYPERTDSTDIADYIIEGLRPQIIKDKVKVFWKKSEKKSSEGDKLEIMPSRYGRFLEENGFIKYYPDGSNDFEFCKTEGKFVDLTSTSRIKDEVLGYLKEPQFNDEPHDFFFLNTKFFSEEFLSGISPKNIDINRDTKTEAFVYYQNCVVKVTAEKIETIPYAQVKGFVWRKHALKRNFVASVGAAKEKGEYERFVELISGNEVKTMAFKSAIGYMIHEYRSPSKAKCVILNDENLESEPKGGAGKGIFCQGLSHIRRVAKIDAKQFDAASTFAYETVDPSDQIVEFSDVDKKLDFEKLFNVVTDGFRIGRKYKDPIILPADRSPKIILTTNYAIKGRGGASRRRRYELEFTSYFHEGYTAEDEFKHDLFTDWDKAEWQRFDAFMMHCVQFFLQNGLIKDIHKTLAIKTFEANSSPAFREWCEMEGGPISKIGAHHNREDLLKSYLELNPEHKNWMQWSVMKKYLQAYCDYAGLEMKDGQTIKRWIVLNWKGGVPPVVQSDKEDEEDEPEMDPDLPPF